MEDEYNVIQARCSKTIALEIAAQLTSFAPANSNLFHPPNASISGS